MRNFVQEGKTIDCIAPSGGVVAGMAYKIGSLFVVASTDADEGDAFSGWRLGVYDLPSDTGAAWAQGDLLYWDNTNHVLTKTATSNTKVGVATQAKDSAAATGRICLVPTI